MFVLGVRSGASAGSAVWISATGLRRASLVRITPAIRTGRRGWLFLRGLGNFTLNEIALVCQTAVAGSSCHLGAGPLDKIKNRLEKTDSARHIAARHDNPFAAMSFALMIKCEFNFGPDLKRPFREKADALRRPLDVFLNQIDRVGVTYRDTLSLISPWFGSDRHFHFP